MCRKRPFATRGRERRPARAVVCRIPCLILCLANVEQSSAGGTAFRTDGYQRYLGPCHQLKRGQTIDVVSMNTAATGVFGAQRRPERQPRRHPTHASAASCSKPAQRRPERQPRRHPLSLPHARRRCRRSTKAGASTPATPGRASHDAGRWRARSTKAGASTPATPSGISQFPCAPAALNEGRSVNPGDT